MTKILVDEALRKKLAKVDELAELCDESGKTLGIFYPAEPQEPKLPAGFKSPISDEELNRRKKEPGGQTLAEIWAELEKS
jgi:hypothetical protein